jgi:phage-related protein
MNLKSVAALEIILRARDEASKAVEGVEKKFGGLGGTVGKLASGALKIGAAAIVGLGAAAARAAVALGRMALDAAPIQGIRASFEALNADARKALETLRSGSLGMVTDAELMRNYNEAVQLVGQSFADDLPNAMQYLSKVSASTGKDMGFLLQSLTTGVGRLSPMILDNLGIQVDLVAANEAYAASIGKTSAELTEEEQKAALMAQVLEKLQANTAALPDITGNAATSMAQLKTSLENAKNGIGEALLPALSALLQPLSELAQKYGPAVVAWAQQAGAWLGENIPKALAWLSATWQQVWPQVQAALATAWGIIEPILTTIRGWFDNEGPSALGKLQAVAQTVFAAVQGFVAENLGWVVDWFRENWPLIQETAETVMKAIRTVVEAVLAVVRAFWEEHGERIMAVVQNMWEIIRTVFETTLKNILDVVKVVMQLITGDTEGAMETLRGIWDRTRTAILNIAGNLWDSIKLSFQAGLETIRNAWQRAMDWFRDIGNNIVDGIRNGIRNAWDSFAGWLSGRINDLIQSVLSALGIGSPSRVFYGIGQNMMAGLQQGIERAGALPEVALRGVVTGLAGVPAMAMAGGGGRYGMVVNNYFGRDSVRSDDDIEAIARRIEEMVAIRGVREW